MELLGQLLCGRVVGGAVEPVRVVEVRVREPHVDRVVVHLVDEVRPVHASEARLRHVTRDRIRRVVPGRIHHPADQVFEPHHLAVLERDHVDVPHRATTDAGFERVDRDLVVERHAGVVQSVHGDVKRPDLRRACHRRLIVLIDAEELSVRRVQSEQRIADERVQRGDRRGIDMPRGGRDETEERDCHRDGGNHWQQPPTALPSCHVQPPQTSLG